MLNFCCWFVWWGLGLGCLRGQDVFEVQKDAIPKGARVVIVDDLMATGGTMSAAVELVKAAGAEVMGTFVLVELEDLEGYKKVNAPVFTLLRY